MFILMYGRHVVGIYVDFVRRASIWRPLQNPASVKMATQMVHVAAKVLFVFGFVYVPAFLGAPRCTLIEFVQDWGI